MNRKERIYHIINENIKQEQLIVENESHQHSVPENAETHFHVLLVSPNFQTLKRIDRHKQINRLLKAEFDSGLHALRLSLYSPEEWEKLDNCAPDAPKCRGGSQKEQQHSN